MKSLKVSNRYNGFDHFIVTGCSQETVVRSATSPSPSAVPTVAPVSTGSKMIPAKIVRVVDGDTMKVSFNESGKVKEETIRLLLVDTPESVDPEKPVQPFALEASKFAKDTLNEKEVRLELDVSERDKYGRLLCYLYIGIKCSMKCCSKMVTPEWPISTRQMSNMSISFAISKRQHNSKVLTFGVLRTTPKRMGITKMS